MKNILFFILFLTMVSCKKDQTITHEIISFDKQISDTIIPIKGENYGAKLITIKGYVDDTVWVSYGGNYNKQYLNKEIDTSFLMDYYGESKAIFVFNPYKARKGKLKISFKI